jgi:hypothetical protein
MSRLSEIKAFYDMGDYLQAREACLEGIYECQEHAFLHSGTELEKSRDSELKEYLKLKDRVSFKEIQDYFRRKTSKGWRPEMLDRLNHFIETIRLIAINDQEALKSWVQKAPSNMLFSEYKKLIQHLDQTNILMKKSELINWLQSTRLVSQNKMDALKETLNSVQAPSAPQTVFAKALMREPQQMQLGLFPNNE